MFEVMYFGCFWLGLGIGEVLNEYIVFGYWLEVGECLLCMWEVIEFIIKLFIVFFEGKDVKYDGWFFKMEIMWLWIMFE